MLTAVDMNEGGRRKPRTCRNGGIAGRTRQLDGRPTHDDISVVLPGNSEHVTEAIPATWESRTVGDDRIAGYCGVWNNREVYSAWPFVSNYLTLLPTHLLVQTVSHLHNQHQHRQNRLISAKIIHTFAFLGVIPRTK